MYIRCVLPGVRNDDRIFPQSLRGIWRHRLQRATFTEWPVAMDIKVMGHPPTRSRGEAVVWEW